MRAILLSFFYFAKIQLFFQLETFIKYYPKGAVEWWCLYTLFLQPHNSPPRHNSATNAPAAIVPLLEGTSRRGDFGCFKLVLHYFLLDLRFRTRRGTDVHPAEKNGEGMGSFRRRERRTTTPKPTRAASGMEKGGWEVLYYQITICNTVHWLLFMGVCW